MWWDNIYIYGYKYSMRLLWSYPVVHVDPSLSVNQVSIAMLLFVLSLRIVIFNRGPQYYRETLFGTLSNILYYLIIDTVESPRRGVPL